MPSNHKILFVVDKLEFKYFEFNNLVTNFWMIRELLRSKQDVYVTTVNLLGLKQSNAYCKCFRTFRNGDDIFKEDIGYSLKVNSFDMLIFRPDPPVDMNYINATYVLDFVDREKTVMINDPKSIRDFNEKLHSNFFSEFMPDNIVTSSRDEIEEFLNINGEIILKPLNKCFGAGVMFLRKNDENVRAIINTTTQDETALTMVQKYIPLAKYGDKRVLTLGENVLEECVIKLPTKDDFKFNTHSDEYIKKAMLSDNEKRKFTQVARKLNSIGIFMAGLDVIDEQIIEINVTSPCYFIKEINNYFFTNLEERVNDFVLSKSTLLSIK